jgi:hypothetical protein
MVVAQRKSQVEHFIVIGCSRTAGLDALSTSPLDLGLDVEKDSSVAGSPAVAGNEGLVGVELSPDLAFDSTGDVSGLAVVILAELGDGERDREEGPLALGLSGPLPASWRSRCE